MVEQLQANAAAEGALEADVAALRGSAAPQACRRVAAAADAGHRLQDVDQRRDRLAPLGPELMARHAAVQQRRVLLHANVLQPRIRALGERRQVAEEHGQRLLCGRGRLVPRARHEADEDGGGEERDGVVRAGRVRKERQEVLVGVRVLEEGRRQDRDGCGRHWRVSYGAYGEGTPARGAGHSPGKGIAPSSRSLSRTKMYCTTSLRLLAVSRTLGLAGEPTKSIR